MMEISILVDSQIPNMRFIKTNETDQVMIDACMRKKLQK
jgi:hypothetical protein